MDETLTVTEDQNAAEESSEELETTLEEGDESEGHESSSDEDATSTETAETETSSEKTEEKTDQEKIDYSFKKKQFELQTAKREIENNATALKAAQDKIAELTQTIRPEVPDMPDTFDDDFDAKMALRDEALRAQERYDQEKNFNVQKQQHLMQTQQDERIETLKTSQKKYSERAEELKIDPTLLLSMENEISTFISPSNAQTAEFLLNHKDGPLLVQHLYANPSELEKIALMSPVNAAVHIATKIVPEVRKSIKQSVKQTPAPHETFESKAQTSKQDPALDGAVFD